MLDISHYFLPIMLLLMPFDHIVVWTLLLQSFQDCFIFIDDFLVFSDSLVVIKWLLWRGSRSWPKELASWAYWIKAREIPLLEGILVIDYIGHAFHQLPILSFNIRETIYEQ